MNPDESSDNVVPITAIAGTNTNYACPKCGGEWFELRRPGDRPGVVLLSRDEQRIVGYSGDPVCHSCGSEHEWVDDDTTEIKPQRCSLCGRERTVEDVFDYHPLQALTGTPFGWYSGDDGEVCPECMEKSIRGRKS